MSRVLNSLEMLLALCRPKNAAPPLLAALIGYSAGGGESFSEAALLSGLFGILCLNFAATLQNDLADRAIDLSAKRATAFLKGRIAAGQLRSATLGLIALGMGVPLLFGQKAVVVFLLVYLLLCWAYNLTPIQASRRPLSSITLLALLFHTLPFVFGAYLAIGAGDHFLFAVLMVGGFAVRFALSMLKDYKDYEADKRHGKRTFLLAFGGKVTKRVSMSLSTLGYAVTLAALYIAGVPLYAVAALVPLAVYGILLRKDLGVEQGSFARDNKLFHQALGANNIFDVGIILCFYFW